jgi:hypothetical protein
MSKVVCKLNQLISLDFHPDKLIVRLLTFGHEIMSDLLVAMTKSDTSYPEDYGGSSIMTGGNTNILYDSGGFKVPDFSLYEAKDSEIPSLDVTNCDAWTIFSFSLPLFIACTITVGHVTDDLYFCM